EFQLPPDPPADYLQNTDPEEYNRQMATWREKCDTIKESNAQFGSRMQEYTMQMLSMARPQAPVQPEQPAPDGSQAPEQQATAQMEQDLFNALATQHNLTETERNTVTARANAIYYDSTHASHGQNTTAISEAVKETVANRPAQSQVVTASQQGLDASKRQQQAARNAPSGAPARPSGSTTAQTDEIGRVLSGQMTEADFAEYAEKQAADGVDVFAQLEQRSLELARQQRRVR
ncbi:MAG: hypothetical protein U9Q07_07420, partial [Planctomycetota bacterium]|nr:hypothetical protein [Planctomycetota bacterium]